MEKTGESIGAEFLRGDSVKIARALLGAKLCRRCSDGRIVHLPITETEAYDGFEDRASHAFKGRTNRTEVMFGDAGFWYVYLCYGVHWMLNIVTRPSGYPAAVLLRGAGSWDGPGKLTKGLSIDQTFNRRPAATETGLWLEWSSEKIEHSRVAALPRVGVDYAGPLWKAKPWRFRLS